MDPSTYRLALRNQGAPGTRSKNFILTGKGGDGEIFFSDRVYILGDSFSSDGSHIHCRINISSSVSKITLSLSCPVEKPFLRLWLRSFKSFRNPIIETPLGTLVVQGKAKDVSSDDMSGCIAIQAPSHDPGSDWYEEADRFLTHMHRGLALANGGRLQTTRLDYIHGSTWETTFFDGEGFRPEFPVQHHLNQGPSIRALADRFHGAGPLPDILWTALGWMQTHTTFDETRFLTAMTALEAIINSELPRTIIPENEFACLRRKIKKVIQATNRSRRTTAMTSSANLRSSTEKRSRNKSMRSLSTTKFQSKILKAMSLRTSLT